MPGAEPACGIARRVIAAFLVSTLVMSSPIFPHFLPSSQKLREVIKTCNQLRANPDVSDGFSDRLLGHCVESLHRCCMLCKEL